MAHQATVKCDALMTHDNQDATHAL